MTEEEEEPSRNQRSSQKVDDGNERQRRHNTNDYCIEYSDIEKAACRINGLAHVTPVLTSTTINNELTSSGLFSLFFKVEALQKTGSFKFRGACNAVQSLLEEKRRQEQEQQQNDDKNSNLIRVVTHSSGNHAQALALAAKLSSSSSSTVVEATIVMPESTPKVKKKAVLSYGGIPIMTANSNQAREDKADEIRSLTGAAFIHPSEDPLVIAGQGTVCLEFLKQVLPTTLDTVIIPVGGGGLASGNAVALKYLQPNINVILAEPMEMDDAKRSFYSKMLCTHHPDNPLHSVADGLKTTLGKNTWPIVRDFVDDIYTVSEYDILRATKLIWERLKVCIEPSAGVGVAVALYNNEFRKKYGGNGSDQEDQQKPPPKKNVGIILCGGNVDILKVSQLMREAGIE